MADAVPGPEIPTSRMPNAVPGPTGGGGAAGLPPMYVGVSEPGKTPRLTRPMPPITNIEPIPIIGGVPVPSPYGPGGYHGGIYGPGSIFDPNGSGPMFPRGPGLRVIGGDPPPGTIQINPNPEPLPFPPRQPPLPGYESAVPPPVGRPPNLGPPTYLDPRLETGPGAGGAMPRPTLPKIELVPYPGGPVIRPPTYTPSPGAELDPLLIGGGIRIPSFPGRLIGIIGKIGIGLGILGALDMYEQEFYPRYPIGPDGRPYRGI